MESLAAAAAAGDDPPQSTNLVMMDDDDDASSVHTAVAPGSDAQTTDDDADGGFVMEVHSVHSDHIHTTQVPRLALPRTPQSYSPVGSAVSSPRQAVDTTSVRLQMSVQVRARPTTHVQFTPTDQEVPVGTGLVRVHSRTGSLPSAGYGMSCLARASMAMRRVKVTFSDSRLQPCLFCARPFAIGHATLTLTHWLRSDDLQLCGVSIGLICCTCAPRYMSKEDAQALPIHTFSAVYLKKRFSVMLNTLQRMCDTPMPHLDYYPAHKNPLCVLCRREVPAQLHRNPLTVIAMINRHTQERAIHAVCSNDCRDKWATSLELLNKNIEATLPVAENNTDNQLYQGRTSTRWSLLTVDDTRAEFPSGLDTSITHMKLHSTCSNPYCFVCDWVNRDPSVTTRRKLTPATMTRLRHRPAAVSAGMGDNYAWIDAMFARVREENILCDWLMTETDVKCVSCGRVTEKVCPRCRAAAICSPECGDKKRHSEVCFDERLSWTDVLRQ